MKTNHCETNELLAIQSQAKEQIFNDNLCNQWPQAHQKRHISPNWLSRLTRPHKQLQTNFQQQTANQYHSKEYNNSQQPILSY